MHAGHLERRDILDIEPPVTCTTCDHHRARMGAIIAAGLTVVVIGSRQVRNLRSRYRSSGGKDDHSGAFVLADTLRTDRARLRPLVTDSPATAALRAEIAARLTAGGLSADTPVLATQWGTRPEQESARTTLGGLAALPLSPPAIPGR